MHRTGLLVVGAAVVLAAVARARADDIVIFNSGVDDSGHVLPSDTNDPHYRIVQRPVGPALQARVANAHEAYVPNDEVGSSGSSWICENGFTDDAHAPGTYVYRTTFDLTGLDPATASLSGDFAADDTLVDVKVNGVSTGIDGGWFLSFARPFTIGSGFVAGVNTLDFVVLNGGGSENPTGFRVVIAGTADPAIVADVEAPVLAGVADHTCRCTGPQVPLSADDLGITATDDVDGPVPVALDPTFVAGLGSHPVTASCHDAAGNCASATFTVTIVDEDAPIFTSLSISEPILTHVNHKMQHLVVSATASDPSDSAPTIRIVEVTCDEAADEKGSGKTSPDWAITGDLTLDLRAERSGRGDGRIYTITVECVDAAGNATRGTLTVTVPHDKRKKKPDHPQKPDKPGKPEKT